MYKINLKIAFRNLWKNRSFSLINIGGLAIGIASAILLLLYVAYEWNFNKQFKDHDRIYVVYSEQFASDRIFCFTTAPQPLAAAIQQSVPGVESVVRTIDANDELLAYKENSFTDYNGLFADSSFFSLFHCRFIEGLEDHALADPNSIVLSKRMAEVLFGKDDPLNKIVKWNNKENLRVTGIIENPEANSWMGGYDYIVTWHLLEKEYDWIRDNASSWSNNSNTTFVKLRNRQYFLSADQLTRKIIGDHQGNGRKANQAFLFPLSKWHLYGQFENGKSVGGEISKVRIFLVLAFCILLIACINFMNLTTARTQKRAREVGIRKVVGSSYGALVRQFISESALYVLIALIVAVVLVELSLPFFNRLLDISLHLSYSSLYLWLGLGAVFVLTSLVAGSYPSFYLSSFSPVKVLKGSSKTGRGVSVLRKVLVIFQFVFTVSLIIAIAVIYLQINYIKNKPVGYNQNSLLEIPITGELIQNIPLFKDELLRSGVVDAASPLSISMTQGGYNGWGISWPGKPPEENILFDFLFTGYDFSQTTGVQMTLGRDFSLQFPSDSNGVLINTTAAKIMGLKTAGTVIKWGGKPRRVIGIFDDFVKTSPFQKVNPMLVALGKSNDYYGIMAVRVNSNQNLVVAVDKIENIEKKLNPAYPPQVNFVSQKFEQKFESQRLLGVLANLFGGLAVFISCLGLFGLTLYTAEQRTKEIGIRRVLGASVNKLMLLVSKDFIILVLIAAIIACPVGYFLMTQWLKGFDYHITVQWYIYVLAFFVALVIALFSVGWQSWRSAKANPVDALKYE